MFKQQLLCLVVTQVLQHAASWMLLATIETQTHSRQVSFSLNWFQVYLSVGSHLMAIPRCSGLNFES